MKPTAGKSQSPWPPEPKPGSAEVGRRLLAGLSGRCGAVAPSWGRSQSSETPAAGCLSSPSSRPSTSPFSLIGSLLSCSDGDGTCSLGAGGAPTPPGRSLWSCGLARELWRLGEADIFPGASGRLSVLGWVLESGCQCRLRSGGRGLLGLGGWWRSLGVSAGVMAAPHIPEDAVAASKGKHRACVLSFASGAGSWAGTLASAASGLCLSQDGQEGPS